MHHHRHSILERMCLGGSQANSVLSLSVVWGIAAFATGCGGPAPVQVATSSSNAQSGSVTPSKAALIPPNSVPTNPQTLARIKEAFAKTPVRPLPKDADVSQSFRNRQIRTDFWRHVFLDGFRAQKAGDPSQTAAAEKFLDGYCLRLGESLDAPSSADLLEQGKVLYESRGTDPHLNLALAAVLFDAQRSVPPQLTEIVNSLEATGQGGPYSPWLTARIHRLKATLLSMAGGDQAVARREQMQFMIDDLLRAGSQAGLTNLQRRMLVQLLWSWRNEFPAGEFRVDLSLKLDKIKNLDPWIHEIILARFYYAVAWKIRGNGSANSITGEDRQRFLVHLEHSRRHALRAWELKPELPEGAAEMLKITMTDKGAAGGEVRFWFDEAVQADFADLDVYFDLAWALRPRWGGSHEKMIAFGDECLATERFDTDVPPMFHKMVSEVVEERGNWTVLLQSPGLYERYVVLFEAMAKNAKTDIARHRYRSRLAAISFLAGKTDQTSQLLSQLKDNAVPQEFEAFNLSLETIREGLGVK
jgi:hypothetical protein